MSRRNTKQGTALVRQVAELAFATPQVVAHRMARMALAGALPSVRDRTEFQRMGNEKVVAFASSWQAMALQACLANQQLALSFMTPWWLPGARAMPSATAVAQQMAAAGLGIVHKGLMPVHRSATANARRLGRTRLA